MTYPNWSDLSPNENGLVVGVIQDRAGTVRMVGAAVTTLFFPLVLFFLVCMLVSFVFLFF